MTDQKWMVAAMDSLLQDCPDDMSVLANACAFLFSEMEEVNWLGFYRVHQNQLYLGPFQGLPACTTIAMGKGACGRAALHDQVVVLDDVRLEENYIACHEETRAEMVIPLHKANRVVAVLDMDSLRVGRFQTEDQLFITEIAKIIEKYL